MAASLDIRVYKESRYLDPSDTKSCAECKKQTDSDFRWYISGQREQYCKQECAEKALGSPSTLSDLSIPIHLERSGFNAPEYTIGVNPMLPISHIRGRAAVPQSHRLFHKGKLLNETKTWNDYGIGARAEISVKKVVTSQVKYRSFSDSKFEVMDATIEEWLLTSGATIVSLSYGYDSHEYQNRALVAFILPL